MKKEDCIFCRIVTGEVPSDIVFRTERAIAFRDINPQAPLHFIVIPKDHVETVSQLGNEFMVALGDVFRLFGILAGSYGVDQKGYRIVFNEGPDAGRTVSHAHFHFLAGRPLHWPPG